MGSDRVAPHLIAGCVPPASHQLHLDFIRTGNRGPGSLDFVNSRLTAVECGSQPGAQWVSDYNVVII
jgi:hypothetical protein